MSRVGNKLIPIPEGIEVKIKDQNLVEIKSSTKELKYQFNPSLNINIKNNYIAIVRPNDEVFMKKIHGTSRALLANMITSISQYSIKKLEISGLGYDVKQEGSNLVFNLGFSHIIKLLIPNDLQITINKNKEIVIKGIDKQFVGEFASKIAKLRKPSPYKGNGIRFVGKYYPRKAGKSAKK
ncbi:50S ribosomal protein L6 [Candidatus Phytoplasma pini]|uniref:50S ribosomal protein L6 n=1 Tax=Candidatus Phytoplasma pini TaxID=267362 RepID=A0A559KJN5_9MOLU|nr:50S ribosomal protein L6 [Candidatus Phytoplasma pini]TVY12344.1 50S ribosomal protein L6 [Candidatus Phytoplasma pini]